MVEVNSKFWSLTYDRFQKDVKKPEDNMIILVHWLLLNNDFRVLGPGKENTIDEDEKPSDFLPTNWSEDITYKLRYVRNNKLFLLTGIKVLDSLIFNFYNVSTKNVSSAAYSDISTTAQCLSDMEKNKYIFNEAANLFQSNLINPMQTDDKKIASTQTASIDPLPQRKPMDSPLLAELINDPRHPLSSYGRSDLDPLGAIRNPDGSMLFDPLRIRHQRPFNPIFPPTARFDPIRPPNPDSTMPNNWRSRPNPDHMRPPNFEDDMYM